MAEYTPNLNLKKPEYGEYADVDAINDNMDILDEVVKQAQDDIDAVEGWQPSGNGTTDQILRTNGDGTTRWDDAATGEEIGAAVTTWLEANIAGGETIAVDSSLSVSGAAADAKVTGNKIMAVESAFDASLIELETNYTLTKGSYWKSADGTTTSSNKYIRSTYKINNAGKIAIGLVGDTYRFGLIFFDSSDNVSGNISASDTSKIKYIPKTAAKLAINIKRADDAAVSDSDVSTVQGLIKAYVVTDTTLTKENAPADAKATGDTIDDLKSAFNNDREVELLAPIEYETTIVSGDIGNSGDTYSISTRSRTNAISVDSNRTYLVLLDDDNYAIRTLHLYSTTTTSGHIRSVPKYNNTRNILFKSDSNAVSMRITFSNADSSTNMSDNDRTAIASSLKIFALTDKSLSLSNVPADAKATGDAIMNTEDKVVSVISALTESIDKTYSMSIGSIGSNGKAFDATVNARTGYIKISQNAPYFINLKSTDYKIVSIHLYGAKNYETHIGTAPLIDRHFAAFDNESDSNYMRILFRRNDFADMQSSDLTAIEEALAISTFTGTTKKQKTDDYEFFTVTVPRPAVFGGEEKTATTEEIQCVLRLPDSYGITGKPTRLVLCCHGSGSYIDPSSTGQATPWSGDGWKACIDSLLDAGYAAFDANIYPATENDFGETYGSPLYINVLKKAYDYIVENYNVHDKIFVHGYSMGGIGATCFAHTYPQIVLAESSFAGRDICLYLKNIAEDIWDTTMKNKYAKAIGYSTWNDAEADKLSHIEGMYPSLSIIKYTNGAAQLPPDRETDFANWLNYYGALESYDRTDNPDIMTGLRRVPYKAWNSWDDNEHQTKIQLILQKAYNTGCSCPYYNVVYDDGTTHTELGSGVHHNMRQQLISWFKRWE